MRSSRTTIGLSVLALLFTGYSAWLGFPGTALTWCVTGFVAAAAIGSLAASRIGGARLHVAIPAALLAGMVAIVASSLAGHQLLAVDPYHDPRYAGFLTALLGLAIVGIARGWLVARWLALALAVAGIVSAGLNLAPWLLHRGEYTWALAIHIGGALLILANMLGADVRARFERDAAPVWTSADPIVRSIRHSIIACLAAIPMLLVYAWMQPIVEATATTAVVLAGFLIASVVLALSRRLIGAALLVIGGAALIAQSATTMILAHQGSALAGRISIYYAVFWIPAGLLALFCGARLARPTLRLLRDGSDVRRTALRTDSHSLCDLGGRGAHPTRGTGSRPSSYSGRRSAPLVSASRTATSPSRP